MTDLEFIKNFQKITITNICKKLNINRGNFYSNKVKPEDVTRIKEQIELEFNLLYRGRE